MSPNPVSKWTPRFHRGRLAGCRQHLGHLPADDPRRPAACTPETNRRGQEAALWDFGVAPWTLQSIGDLVAQFSVWSTSALHKLGLTSLKPTRRAFNRDACDNWNWTQIEFSLTVLGDQTPANMVRKRPKPGGELISSFRYAEQLINIPIAIITLCTYHKEGS